LTAFWAHFWLTNEVGWRISQQMHIGDPCWLHRWCAHGGATNMVQAGADPWSPVAAAVVPSTPPGGFGAWNRPGERVCATWCPTVCSRPRNPLVGSRAPPPQQQVSRGRPRPGPYWWHHRGHTSGGASMGRRCAFAGKCASQPRWSAKSGPRMPSNSPQTAYFGAQNGHFRVKNGW
jgi:hypothetical protein